MAARRRIDRARYVAAQDDPLAAELRVRDGDRGHERLRVGVLRVAEHLAPVGDLHDLAEVHHGHPVADVLNHAHVVGDEQVRQPELPLQIAQQVQDLRLDRYVEGGYGLVADNEVGLQDQRPGDPDPLSLTPRELVRIAPRVVRLEAHEVHHPGYLAAAFAPVAEAVDAQPFADAVGDRCPWIEARVRVLEDHLHPAPIGLEVGALEAGDVLAVEADRSRGRIDQPQQQPPDGRLAAAGLANQSKRLAPLDVEADVVHGLHQGHGPLRDAALHREVLDEVADLDKWRGGLGGGHGSFPVAATGTRARSLARRIVIDPAADGVAGMNRKECGVLLEGVVDSLLDPGKAAGSETAASRQVDEVRDVARDDGQCVALLAERPGSTRSIRACRGAAGRGTATRRRSARRSRRRTSRRPGRTSRRPRPGRG